MGCLLPPVRDWPSPERRGRGWQGPGGHGAHTGTARHRLEALRGISAVGSLGEVAAQRFRGCQRAIKKQEELGHPPVGGGERQGTLLGRGCGHDAVVP